MSGKSIRRILSEFAKVQHSSDLSIAVRYNEEDVSHARTMIIGPHGTPYENGFFEFNFQFGNEYPNKPPTVLAKTTNSGCCRFNPNIYSCGKVCLSILGTWQGEQPGEEWSPAQGIESILWSIQSLLSDKPYENEPGYEGMSSPEALQSNKAYCEKIRHETLRIAVIQQLESALKIYENDISGDTPTDEKASYNQNAPSGQVDSGDEDDEEQQKLTRKNNKIPPVIEGFKDHMKQRFLWYYTSYFSTIEKSMTEQKDGTKFTKMPFEGSTNGMHGTFEYEELSKRLVRIKDALVTETLSWAPEGELARQEEFGIACNLKAQFEQVVGLHNQQNKMHIAIELQDGNPFLWLVTYFGQPGTYLDGSMIKLRVHLSVRFPQEQPRVRVDTQLFHHRVSPIGFLCYFPQKVDDMQSHVDGIIESLENDAPTYDPRTIVHPEASKLIWGSADERKMYYRRLRRTAQASFD